MTRTSSLVVHAHRFLRLALGVVLLTCAVQARAATGGAWQSAPYTLGRGLYFPQQDLRIGGYSTLQYYGLEDRPRTVSLHDTSLFVTKGFGTRWKFFSEAEASDALSVTGHHSTTRHAEFDLERVYLDYHVSRGMTLRVGKFLTPIGQWNLVHADPLVWTVSRPLTTSAAFARHAAGAMIYGTVSVARHDLDYWIFGDDSQALDRGPQSDRAFADFGANSTLRNSFRHALGGQVLYHLLDDRLSVGATLVNFELDQPRHHYRLEGINVAWSTRYVDLSGEGIYRSADGPQEERQYGGYLQAVVPLPRQVYLVGRYERYRSSTPTLSTSIRTLAVNWRPMAGLTLKLEHRNGTRNIQLQPDGWLASVSVLF